MLLIDGVKYELWTRPSEDDLEQMVKEHAQDIFGENSIYFDRKQKMKSIAGIGSIPDAYVIVFTNPPEWHIVEVELSHHPLHEHIVSQVGRFISGIRNLSTQKGVVEAIYAEICKDDLLKLRIQKAVEAKDAHFFLSDLISKLPVLTIIIEKRTEELNEALSALAHPQIKIVEFQTFMREGVGLGAHVHLFEPLYAMSSPKPSPPLPGTPKGVSLGTGRVTLRELIDNGLIRPGQKLFRTDKKGTRYEAEILAGGQLRLLHDNTEWKTLSKASGHITNTSINGWIWWYTQINGQQCLMDDLRRRLQSK